MPKYQKISKNIEEVILSSPRAGEKIRWLNIANPGKEELEYLRRFKQYGFNFQELRASSAKIKAERPMIEKREKYFFFILHFPVFSGNEIGAVEVDFFISHELLITLHNGKIATLNNFFNTVKKDGGSALTNSLPSAAILLYELLKKLILACYEILDQNSAKINEAEKIIFSRQQKKAVSKILELKHNIINIRRIVTNYKSILKKIMEMKSAIVSANRLRTYYFYLIDQTKRIWEFSESQKETIEALSDTNESLLNYSISDIMKTLTIFSVIIFPLTLIATVFSMKIDGGMPFINNPHGFWMVMGIMGLGCFGMLYFFSRKKWL
jgi:magnesium transporter